MDLKVNNYRLILTNRENTYLEFNIDQFSNFYVSEFKNVFKLQSEILGNILIDFDKNFKKHIKVI